MKYSILFLFVLLSFGTKSLAQNIEDCGKDDNPLLTLEEAVFLQKYFDEEIRHKKYFDFEGKKILFTTGSMGMIITTKSLYFESIKRHKEEHNSTINTSVYELTEAEKAEFGYDAIITMWTKMMLSPKARKRVLNSSKKPETLNLKQNNK